MGPCPGPGLAVSCWGQLRCGMQATPCPWDLCLLIAVTQPSGEGAAKQGSSGGGERLVFLHGQPAAGSAAPSRWWPVLNPVAAAAREQGQPSEPPVRTGAALALAFRGGRPRGLGHRCGVPGRVALLCPSSQTVPAISQHSREVASGRAALAPAWTRRGTVGCLWLFAASGPLGSPEVLSDRWLLRETMLPPPPPRASGFQTSLLVDHRIEQAEAVALVTRRPWTRLHFVLSSPRLSASARAVVPSLSAVSLQPRTGNAARAQAERGRAPAREGVTRRLLGPNLGLGL